MVFRTAVKMLLKMELHTPFAIQVAWDLGHLSLHEAVARLAHWPLPKSLRLRSTHEPPVHLDVHALASVLASAPHADRCADMNTLVDALMTPFLRNALDDLTAALGARPFKHGLLQLGLKYLPLRRDPPGTYDRFLDAFGTSTIIVLNPYNVAIANVPAGLRALRVGMDIHIGISRDRMARIIIHSDASATMSSIGAVLRPFVRMGIMCITDSVVGALPGPTRSLAWSLTQGTLPPDDATHHRLLLAVRRLFAMHAPPSSLPPPVKRQRDLELHLSLLDALWRADLERVHNLLHDDDAPVLPPYAVPACMRAHVYTDRGPRILDVIHNAPDIMGHALKAGLWLPLMDAALWIVRRPCDLTCVLAHCDLDPTALLEAVLVYCDSHVPDEAPLTVVPDLLARADLTVAHMQLVRRRPDLFRLMYAAVGAPAVVPDCLEHAFLELVPTLLDGVSHITEPVRQALLRRADLPDILRHHRPDLGPALLDHIVVADLDDAFAAVVSAPPSAAILALAIAVVSPAVVARCVALGRPVAAAHLVPLIEASEDTLHPMFWPVAQLATDRVLHEAFRISILPCCFSLAVVDAGITDPRLMSCIRAAGLYVPHHV